MRSLRTRESHSLCGGRHGPRGGWSWPNPGKWAGIPKVEGPKGSPRRKAKVQGPKESPGRREGRVDVPSAWRRRGGAAAFRSLRKRASHSLCGGRHGPRGGWSWPNPGKWAGIPKVQGPKGSPGRKAKVQGPKESPGRKERRAEDCTKWTGTDCVLLSISLARGKHRRSYSFHRSEERLREGGRRGEERRKRGKSEVERKQARSRELLCSVWYAMLEPLGVCG